MLYLISYDIPASPSGDRRRARLAKYLESIGLRVQNSVFELEIDPGRLEAIAAEILDRIEPAEDSVRIYTICAACARHVFRLGISAPAEHSPFLIL